MMRSLFSGISGLRNHQSQMDVVGNNISNVNTVGYKTGRMTFAESLSQTLAGATRPGGVSAGRGGTNPIQVGLGVTVGSVDNVFSQGNFERTGQVTDLAVEGNAFFLVNDGQGTYYTRNGSFQLDASGRMVLPSNGFVLQGMMATSTGEFAPGTAVSDIVIPVNAQSPARETQEVKFGRNLDSNSAARGTITQSSRFLTYAPGTTTIRGLYNSKGDSLGMLPEDTLSFSATNPGTGATVTSSMTLTNTTSINDIASAIQTFLAGPAGSAGATVAVQPDGSLQFTAGGQAIRNFQVKSDRPISSSYITNAFNVDSTIAAGATDSTDQLRSPAQANTLLANVFDQTGTRMGLEAGDVLQFNGAIGGTLGVASSIVYNPATTTMQSVLTAIKDQLRLPEVDSTPDQNFSVALNDIGSDDNLTDGAVIIRGMPEKAFELTNITSLASNSNGNSPDPVYFNQNMVFKETQEARNTGVVDTAISIYDDAGFEHKLTMTFTHSGRPDEWLWEVKTAGQEDIVGGGKGRLTFGPDGTLSSFLIDDGTSRLTIDPKNGAGIMDINLNLGGPQDYQGLTQFRSASTAAALGQDGYTTGRLKEMEIGADGLVTGHFTNGVNQKLAQLVVAEFTNPSGLLKASESVYSTSNNSGDPIIGKPGDQTSNQIRSGVLEMSNVDLAEEFTNMITTQRGYQANARVISTSDRFLEELVNLNR